jgi:hypothetical protein
MKLESAEALLPFYFGTVDETERLRVERTLLEDPEALIDYLDLKRKLEAAMEVPVAPSAALWAGLSERLRRTPRSTWIVWGAGLAAAACLAVALGQGWFRSTRHGTGGVGLEKGILLESSPDCAGCGGAV